MSWKSKFENAIEQRQDRMGRVIEVVACFSTLAVGAERLYDECSVLQAKCRETDLLLQEARSELSMIKSRQSVGLSSTPPNNSSVDLKKMAELEARYALLKDERSELYKAQSQNTMKLLELSDQLKQREAKIGELLKELELTKSERKRFEQRLEDYENLVREKNFTIQILQDELTALQLELIKVDEESAASEGFGTMLRRVSIGGVPINGDYKSPQMVIDFDHIPKNMTLLFSNSECLSCVDASEDTLVFASGNQLTCRVSSSEEWTIKVNAKICRLSLDLQYAKGIILCARRDGIVSVVNYESHRIRGQLVSPDIRELSDMAVCSDNEHLWTLSPNCLKYWHCDRFICLRTISVIDGKCLCVLPDDSVFVGTSNGVILRLANDTLKTIFTGCSPAVSLQAAGDKHGELIAAAFTDKIVLLQRDRPVQTFTVPSGGPNTRAGFFKDTHLYVIHGPMVTLFGLSGFASERQLSLGDNDSEHIIDLLPGQDLLISNKSFYKLTY